MILRVVMVNNGLGTRANSTLNSTALDLHQMLPAFYWTVKSQKKALLDHKFTLQFTMPELQTLAILNVADYLGHINWEGS